MSKLNRYINLLLSYLNEFGFIYTMNYCIHVLKKDLFGKINLMCLYLEHELKPVIEKYQNYDIFDSNCNISKTIWVFWWQGYDEMPVICQCCFDNLVKKQNGVEVVLITKDNFKEYVEISPRIIDLFVSKKISLALFSDVLRNCLLTQNGGIWLDATIWINESIDEKIWDTKKWWSVKIDSNNISTGSIGQTITQGNWAGFIQAGSINNIVNSFVMDCFNEYFDNHNMIIDYFIQNLFILVGYRNITQIRNIIDNIEYSNPNIYWLEKHLNEVYDSSIWNDICQSTNFFKLTYKKDYIEEVVGEGETFYGFLYKK